MRKDLRRFGDFWWSDRGLSSFLFLLFLLFLLSPFISSSLAKTLLSIFLTLLLISGVANVTERRFFRYVAFVVAFATLVLSILQQLVPGRTITVWWHLCALAFFFLMVSILLIQVFHDGTVTAHRVRGAIAVYLLIGITWTFIYQLIALTVPGALSVPSSLTAQPGEPQYRAALTYFSFVTMTTLGYGDITPVHPAARMFVILEALIGQLYPATLLARLVSLEIMHRGEGGKQQKRKEQAVVGNKPGHPVS